MADDKATEFFESFEDDLNDGECTNEQLKQIKEVANDFLGDYTPNLMLSPFYEVFFCVSKCKDYKANKQKYCRKPKLVERVYLILQILFFASYLCCHILELSDPNQEVVLIRNLFQSAETDSCASVNIQTATPNSTCNANSTHIGLKNKNDVLACLENQYHDYLWQSAKNENEKHTWAYSIFDLDGNKEVSIREFAMGIAGNNVNVDVLFSEEAIERSKRAYRDKLRTLGELIQLVKVELDLNGNNIVEFNEFVCKFPSENAILMMFDKSCEISYVRVTWEEIGLLIQLYGLPWSFVGFLLCFFMLLHDNENPGFLSAPLVVALYNCWFFGLSIFFIAKYEFSWFECDHDTNHPYYRAWAWRVFSLILVHVLATNATMWGFMSLLYQRFLDDVRIKSLQSNSENEPSFAILKTIAGGFSYMLLSFMSLFFEISLMDGEFDFVSHYVEALVQYQLFTLTVWGFCMYNVMLRYGRLKLSIIVEFELLFVECLMFFGFGLMALSCLIQGSTNSMNPARAFDLGFIIGFTCVLAYWFRNDNPKFLGDPLFLFHNWKRNGKRKGIFQHGYLAVVDKDEAKTREDISPITLEKNLAFYTLNTCVKRLKKSKSANDNPESIEHRLSGCVLEKWENTTIAVIVEPLTSDQEIMVNSKVIDNKTQSGKSTNKIQLELKHKDGERPQVLEIFGGKHNVDFNFVRFVDAKYSLSGGNTWRVDNNSKIISPSGSPSKVLAWVKGRIEVRGSCCRLRGAFKSAMGKKPKTDSKCVKNANKVVPEDGGNH